MGGSSPEEEDTQGRWWGGCFNINFLSLPSPHHPGRACQVNLDGHFTTALKCQGKIFVFVLFCFVLFLILNVLGSEYPGFLAKVS